MRDEQARPDHDGRVGIEPQADRHPDRHADRHWTLLTNHGRVLLLIAQQPELRIRDIADAAGITERTAQMIIADLEHAGYVEKERVGRRNAYSVNRAQPFRHQAESGHTVGELIGLFAPEA